MVGKVNPLEVRPQLQEHEHPWWYHHHGQKMRHTPGENLTVVTIASDAAAVIIHPWKDQWNVRWGLQFSRNESVGGNRIVTPEQLDCAFGIQDEFSQPDDRRHSNWMTQKYGGSIAFQGRFIRWDNYLTIPVPAMGHDGTPCISILLDEDMKIAVRQARFLIGTHM